MIKKFKLTLKQHFDEVFKLKTSTKSVAWGVAVGTMIAVLPTPMLNILLGTLVIFVFKSISKAGVFLPIFFWNPLTLAPVYALSFKIGDWFFGNAPIVKYKLTLLQQVFVYAKRFLVGNVILAVLISIISFFLTYWVVNYYKAKKLKKD